MTGPTDPHQGFFALWSHFYESTPLLGPLLRQQQDHALDRLAPRRGERILDLDRKSTRLNSSHRH